MTTYTGVTRARDPPESECREGREQVVPRVARDGPARCVGRAVLDGVVETAEQKRGGECAAQLVFLKCIYV